MRVHSAYYLAEYCYYCKLYPSYFHCRVFILFALLANLQTSSSVSMGMSVNDGKCMCEIDYVMKMSSRSLSLCVSLSSEIKAALVAAAAMSNKFSLKLCRGFLNPPQSSHDKACNDQIRLRAGLEARYILIGFPFPALSKVTLKCTG